MSVQKKSSRIMTFDLMRGYFLIAITLNHLNYFPNGLSWLTFKGQLFVSSAEGFFLISGLVLGIVRGAKLAAKPFHDVWKILWKRSFQLYVTYVVLAILFTLIGWWFFMDNPGLKPGIASPDTPFFTMVWNVLTFQYLYGWADYLRLYCLFMLISPLVVYLLRQGLWWVAALASIIVWLLAPNLDWPANVYVQPYHWQIIFFGGMIIGYHWQHIVRSWQKLAPLWRKLIIATTVSLAAVTLLGNILLAFGGKYSDELFRIVSPIRDTLSPYFDKENMPLYRLLLFALWFWASFWLFHRLEKPIMRLFGWLLLPLGTNSLYTYIVSGLIIFFVHLFIPISNAFVNFLVTIGIVATIWLMIRHKVLMKIIPR